jgi:hypothetical protein
LKRVLSSLISWHHKCSSSYALAPYMSFIFI